MGGRPKDTLTSVQFHLDATGREITVSGDYLNQRSLLDCKCNLCGREWAARALSLKHNNGIGCVYCSRGYIVSLEQFQYELDSLGKSYTLLQRSEKPYYFDVRCNECLREWSASTANLRNNGCAGCSRKVKGSLINTQNKLNEKSSGILVSGVYKNAYSKLDCTCVVCNSSWSAHSHNLLNNDRGCPSCAKTGYSPQKPGYLYYLKVESDDNVYWKIGITNLGVRKRFGPDDLEKIDVVFEQLFEDGRVAQLAERNILKLFAQYRAVGVKVLKTGNTELFISDVLQMSHLLMRDCYEWS